MRTRLLTIGLVVSLLAGCALTPRQTVAPAEDIYAKAQIAAMQEVRFWGDKPAPYLDHSMQRLKRVLETSPAFSKRIDVLALSGGAEDGAYGAGFLRGWSKRGDRPEFMMVTGVSTGALIAPFAFLGPDYDEAIKRLFTETSRKDIFFLTPLTALVGGAAVGDTAPLRRILTEEIDEDFVAALARESRRGRSLQIATTNLDAQRPVVWEIGRIAESGRPESADLIRKIMLASASVPGAFPPVTIDIVIDGQHYQELHVDGGLTNQVFGYPRELDIREIERTFNISPAKFFWLIRNTKLNPEYQVIDPDISSIVTRAIYTLTKYQGNADVHNIASLAERDGFDFHLTSVPPDFDVPLKDFFDPDYMRALYYRGFQKALSEKPWRTFSNGILSE